MNSSNLFKLIRSLPECVRNVLYVIYLLTQFFKLMKVFFIPKSTQVDSDVEPRSTDVPVATPDGIVHKSMSDQEIIDRTAFDNAMKLDPAYLVAHGIEPKTFSGSVISPLDAIDRISDSVSSIPADLFEQSIPSDTAPADPALSDSAPADPA